MRELDRIAEQLRRAYRGDAWYGPSVRAALNGVDTSVAAAARRVMSPCTAWCRITCTMRARSRC
jgi:hypothetical protein